MLNGYGLRIGNRDLRILPTFNTHIYLCPSQVKKFLLSSSNSQQMKINKNRHCKKDVKTGVTTVVSYHASGYNRAPFLIFFFLAVYGTIRVSNQRLLARGMWMKRVRGGIIIKKQEQAQLGVPHSEI